MSVYVTYKNLSDITIDRIKCSLISAQKAKLFSAMIGIVVKRFLYGVENSRQT